MANITGFNLGKNRKKYIDFVKRVKREGGSYSGVKGRDFKEQLNSLLEYSPSLAVLPNTTKGGKLPTIIPADGSADFTVSRNSTKWVLGKNGYLYEVPANQAAIEFNADGSRKGVLVESQSVNEAKASEDLDNGTYWTLINATIAGDTEIDPKGGTNSFLLSETVDNGAHFIFTAVSARKPIGSGETWTCSWFVKKGDGANAPDIVQISHATGPFGSSQHANFDISVGGGTSGTVTDSSGGTAGIRYYGNGWYRISFTATSTSADNLVGYLIFCNNNPTATRFPSYAGQTDANVFVWGAQLEESPIATSYIPTTTGAVTRLKDDIFFANASSVIGQSEGTLFIEVDWQDSGTLVLLSISDGTLANRMMVYYDVPADKLRGFIESNNVIEVNDGSVLTSLSGIQKIAFVYKQNDAELYRKGSSIFTDTTADLSSLATLTDVDFGQRPNATGQANMWIRAVALFTTRLSDAEAYSLTGYDTYAQMANALQYTIL